MKKLQIVSVEQCVYLNLSYCNGFYCYEENAENFSNQLFCGGYKHGCREIQCSGSQSNCNFAIEHKDSIPTFSSKPVNLPLWKSESFHMHKESYIFLTKQTYWILSFDSLSLLIYNFPLQQGVCTTVFLYNMTTISFTATYFCSISNVKIRVINGFHFTAEVLKRMLP